MMEFVRTYDSLIEDDWSTGRTNYFPLLRDTYAPSR